MSSLAMTNTPIGVETLQNSESSSLRIQKIRNEKNRNKLSRIFRMKQSEKRKNV